MSTGNRQYEGHYYGKPGSKSSLVPGAIWVDKYALLEIQPD
jgi:hypothetical protein